MRKIIDIKIWEKSIIKGLALFSLILINASLLIIKDTPSANRYEFSIYMAFPPILWIILIASYACGIFTIIIEACAYTKNSKTCILGLFILLFTNSIILFLPIFRGYYIYDRGDTLVHIGHMKDIIYYGHFNEKNFYPMVHIWGVIISLINRLNIITVTNIFMHFFIVIHIVFIFLLAKILSKNRKQFALIVAFGSLLPQIYGYTPAAAAISFLPLIIYLFFRSWSEVDNRYSFLLTLFLVVISLFHPLVALYLIVMLILFQILLLIYDKKKKKWLKIIVIIFVASISWLVWFSSFPIFKSFIKRVYSNLFDVGHSQTTHYVNLMRQANTSFAEAIEIIIKMHGQYLLYSILSAIICILVFKNIFSRKKVDFSLFYFSSVFIFFIVLTFLTAISNIIIRYSRTLKYVLFAASFLNGLGTYIFLKKLQRETKIIFCMMILLLIVVSQIFAVFNHFPSPIIKKHNYQVTREDMSGMNWFLAHRNESILVDEIHVWQYRLATALLGFAKPKINLRYHGFKSALPPDHFGYTNHTTLGQLYQKNRYLILNRISEEFYLKLAVSYPSLMRFSPEDFRKLMHDESVNKLYSNEEFKIFVISNR